MSGETAFGASILKDLRGQLQAHGMHALLVPASDAFLNEYVAPHAERRAWLTGFTGSAGDALVGLDKAWLFVDSRYHLQAEQQVDPTVWEVKKLGLPDIPSLDAHLYQLAETMPGFCLATDPATLSLATWDKWAKNIGRHGGKLLPTPDNWVDALRAREASGTINASEKPLLVALPLAVTGQSVAEKLTTLRQKMKEAQLGVLPLIRLDQIAWLTNMRGSDVPHNPVFEAHALITQGEALIFLDDAQRRLPQPPPDTDPGFQHFTCLPLAAWSQTLQDTFQGLPAAMPLRLDAEHLNAAVGQAVQAVGRTWEPATSPLPLLKAIKNDAELAAMRSANRWASVAKTRLLAWLASGKAFEGGLSEADIAAHLEARYAELPDFVSLSFTTIAAFGPNTAIVHYGTPSPHVPLDREAGGLLLLDSGVQLPGGTTDDTRTVWVGKKAPPRLARLRYTQVLRAHIQTAMQPFPKGTSGASLDGITRQSLWHAGLDFGHGTGHGVGAGLNVHEGPNGIHKRAHTALTPGMITSIEPGFYLTGWGGIRLENLAEVKPLANPRHGRAFDGGSQLPWLGFRPLTWIPFDRRLILRAQLSRAEKQWLNQYHREVLRQLRPALTRPELTWLQAACRSI